DTSEKNTPHVDSNAPGVGRINAMLRQQTLDRAGAAVGSRAATTLSALDAIGGHLARVPGRKNLVWVSGSFPFTVGLEDVEDGLDRNATSFAHEVERVTRHLTDANVAVYPVDARGLMALDLAFDGGPHNQPTFGTPSQADFATMAVLADRTGGRSFYNTNDITAAIRSAFDDTKVTYILGYYPGNSQWDGKFRQIKVKVNRAGIHVRARRGYFAREVAGHSGTDLAGALLSSAVSPLEAAAIGLTAEVSPGETAEARTLKLHLTIDARDLLFAQNGDRWKGDLEIVMAEEDSTGRVKFRSEQRYAPEYTQAHYAKVCEQGIRETREVQISPGTISLQIYALDVSAGAIGSVRIPVAQYFPPGN
ncbi:MAG TPA: VWA domain-containing protein, partial [Candidatus Acidoferrales bacterium]|nr:VWA domain-containing protein [Candidatus Acidoferrales bacterium]